MLAKFERRAFTEGCKVWLGKYRSLHNIPHWHYEHELVSCLEGSAAVLLDGQQYRLEAGMCILCPAESPHSIASSLDGGVIVAQFDQSLCAGVAPFWLESPLFEDRYGSYSCMDGMYREQESRLAFCSEKINASMSLLLIEIFRNEPLVRRAAQNQKSIARYKDLLTVIDQSFDHLSFRDAAAFMNMSDAYFSRFFKKVSGMTFSQYLNIVRVGRAIDILAVSPDITMASLMTECGFNTLRNFNRVFKSVTGYSPSTLPRDYSLDYRSLSTYEDAFDPTMDSSILLTNPGPDPEPGSD